MSAPHPSASLSPEAAATERPRVWYNGELMFPEQACISPFDHGLLTGDGVFETMKTYDGVPFEFDRHYNRLLHAAKVFGLNVPAIEVVKDAICKVLEANGQSSGDARLRLTLTAGIAPLGSEKGESMETVIVASGPLPQHPEVAPVVVVPWRRNDVGALTGIKTTSYGDNVIALDHAHRQNANEAIFANTKGNLCEGTGSNVFLVLDGQLITPPLSCGCLPGVTRAVVLELCEQEGIPVKEIDVPVESLETADEAFLTSSLREVLPITSVNGNPLNPGPIGSRLRKAFRARIGRS